MSTTDTATIMEQRKAASIEAINAELWKRQPDPEVMADAAIRGGVMPEEVAALEAKTKAAKSVLEDCEGLDLPALKSDADKLAAEATKAQQAADEAQAKADDAHARTADANDLVAQARHRFDAAARAAGSGDIPAEKLPEAARRILFFNEASAAAAAAEQKLSGTLHDIKRCEGAIKEFERQLEVANRPGTLAKQTVTGAAWVDKKDTLTTQIKTFTATLKAMKKSLPGLEKSAADTAAAKDQAKAAITQA